MADQAPAAFKKRFLKSFFTRLHMSLIMLATVLSGLLFSKLLWWAGLHNMGYRFPLVLLLAYGCFFVLMRLWLVYLTRPFAGGRGQKGGGADFYIAGGGGHAGGSAGGESFFQGGASGGGGASGSWDVDEAPAGSVSAAVASAGSSGGDGGGSGLVGEAVSGLGDGDGWILIPIGIVLLLVFGSSVYLIYEAPAILSEASFEVLLAAGLFKKARKMDDEGWAGSVLRHTWRPFALVLLVTTGLGFLLHSYCPQAGKISQVLQTCL